MEQAEATQTEACDTKRNRSETIEQKPTNYNLE